MNPIETALLALRRPLCTPHRNVGRFARLLPGRHPWPLLLALAAWPTLAAEPGSSTLPTLTVTAKGYDAEAADTAASITAIGREQLDRTLPATLGDALRGQPGLAVASDGAHGQNPVIRGLRREGIVLLVDGMRVNSAQPQGAIASLVDIGLVERVEVVKGPSSVLYGTGALGGAINLRLPQARLEPGVGVRASLRVDSASRGFGAAALLNAVGGDHALMLGGAAQKADDYEAPSGRVPLSGWDSSALIGQYRLRLGPTQQLRVSLQAQRDDDVWYPGSRKPHANLAVVGHTLVHSPRQERRLAEAGWQRKGSGAGALEVDARIYRQEVERQIWSYSDKLQRDIGQTRVTFATDGAELRLRSAVHAQHLLSGGIDAWRMLASPDRRLASPTPASPLVRNLPFEDGRLEATGVYLQDDMLLGDRLSLLAGVRHDVVEGRAASINNGAVTSGLARRDAASSGSVGLMWRADARLRPYANLARGFRAGEMRERFEASPRGDGFHYLGNPQIRSEMATQLELGIKGESAGVSYALALFRNRISDFITGQPTGATVGGLPVKQTVNLGQVVVRGVEAGARWQLRPAHALTLAATVLRGDNRDLDEPLFQMPADELTLGWEGRLGGGWSVDARVRLVRRQDRVATTFARGTENATAGFGTLDLGGTWRLAKGQSLRVLLKNLSDKAYHEHLAEGVSGQEIQAPGRSLSLAWSGSF